MGEGGRSIKRLLVAVSAVVVSAAATLCVDAAALGARTADVPLAVRHARAASVASAPADVTALLAAVAAPPPPPPAVEAEPVPEPAPARQTRRTRAATSAPATAGTAPAPPQLRGGVWAVVVGIDHSSGYPSLVSAGADAADMANVLARLGVPSSQVRYLRDAGATAGAIESSLAWLAANADAAATVVFFFAGHVVELGGGTEALVAADGVAVSDRRVAQLLAPTESAKGWIVIAGCYGGGFTEVLRAGRVLTAAAPAGALAYENELYGRSYLAEFVLNRGLLQGRAGTTIVQEVVAWAQLQLAAMHPNRLLSQTDWSNGPLSVSQNGLVLGPTRTAPASAPPASAVCPVGAICIVKPSDP